VTVHRRDSSNLAGGAYSITDVTGPDMRIALVTSSTPFGGTTTFSLFLLGALRKMGINVSLFSFDNKHPMEREFAKAHIPVVLEDQDRSIFEERLSRIYEKIRDFKPSAVFAVLGRESFEILRYLPDSVLRVGMLHDHTNDVYSLVEDYASHFDLLVVVSAHIYSHVRNHYPEVSVLYLQHGVPLPKWENVRKASGGPLRIIFFGRLQESQKRVRIFPKIYRSLKQRNVEFHWRIHGIGPEESYLRNELSMGIENGDISFSKPVQHEGLTEIISPNDIYLLTSAHEAGPLTLLEGMAHGLVPVCGDIPCLVSEVITPRVGFRVPYSDAEAYADSIAQLARDRDQLEAMSRCALDRIDKSFSAEAMAKRYIAAIQDRLPRSGNGLWSAEIHPKSIIGLRNRFLFSPSGRLLRRLRKWMFSH
jgi:glycosyltransferase involved in cell wall biosynthesis